jgi:steroid 5-alpha reductase family enzyme
VSILDAIPLFLTSFVALSVLWTLFWTLSLVLGDVSFVDGLWGLGFILVATISFFVAPGAGLHKQALLLLSILWGMRLSVHLFDRWRRCGPDPRYVQMLARAKNRKRFSLYYIFLFQGLLIVIIAAPLQMGMMAPASAEPGLLFVAGVILWAIGLYFEAVADAQLEAFKANPENADGILDRGLWRYSRHPNYFGDACAWWGLYLIAADSGPIGAASIFGPLLITWMLMKWSGIPLLEHRMEKSRPAYKEYKSRTNAFFPGKPRG